MRQVAKSLVFKALATVGAFPTKTTAPDELRSLLHKLRPQSTDKELIRLGPRRDGGYLVPDDLSGIQACFSPGVSDESGFEHDCANMGMRVFLADKSVDHPVVQHAMFSFTKKFIGATSDHGYMTLDNWVAASLPPHNSADLLMQIDIEGQEYEVFLSASDTLMRRFRIIVAEFHQLDQLWNRPFFGLVGRTFAKILQTHTCVHMHPNNCCGSLYHNGIELPRIMEFTFLRNDRIKHPTDRTEYPHPLDYDNSLALPSLTLPKCWYAG